MIKELYDRMYDELVTRKMYERFCTVYDNDIVFDIGSNIGLFTKQVADKCQVCYSIEPSYNEFKELKVNVKDNIDKVILSNESIGSFNGISYMNSNEGCRIVVDHETENPVLSITFRDYLKKHNVDKIDFLKLDAEGAEWDIINWDNKDLLQNVGYIAAEFHLQLTLEDESNYEFDKEKVEETFNVLKEMFEVKYASVGGTNLTIDEAKQRRQFFVYAINKNNRVKMNEWLSEIDRTILEMMYNDGAVNLSIFNNVYEKEYNIVMYDNYNGDDLYSTKLVNGWCLSYAKRDEWLIKLYDGDNIISEDLLSESKHSVIKKIK